MCEQDELVVLQQMLNEVLGNNATEKQNFTLSKETLLVNSSGKYSLGLDSIAYVRFMILVEKHYGIKYEYDTIMENVGDLLSYIQDRKNRDNNG